MISFQKKLAACTAIAALGAVSLFAAETSADGAHRHGHRGAFLSSQLNLTPAQQTQTKAIFQDARQSAQPVRQQLKQTRQSLRAAVQANNTAQIQQLAGTEGSESGAWRAGSGACAGAGRLAVRRLPDELHQRGAPVVAGLRRFPRPQPGC